VKRTAQALHAEETRPLAHVPRMGFVTSTALRNGAITITNSASSRERPMRNTNFKALARARVAQNGALLLVCI
jgi:hypothetical protein